MARQKRDAAGKRYKSVNDIQAQYSRMMKNKGAVSDVWLKRATQIATDYTDNLRNNTAEALAEKAQRRKADEKRNGNTLKKLWRLQKQTDDAKHTSFARTGHEYYAEGMNPSSSAKAAVAG